ncbi:unnamed protein product [Lactuca saligna]|uniref:Uncharacterized protein n=1 Tax=Lactuca saligna TaxID=75948 RepID=A0AA35YEI0_LACSI|nr:unnamed protein product [Lactuca saligna]
MSGAVVDVIQRISVSICSLVTKKLEVNSGELPSSDSSIKEDLSNLTIRLFLYIKESHGIEKAFQFLSNISGQKKNLRIVANLTVERDGELKKAALNCFASGYKILGVL